MNKVVPIAIPIICLLSCASNDQAKNDQALSENVSAGWQEIRSEEGNFRIEFPDYEVTLRQATQLIDGKEFTVYQYSLNMQHQPDDNLAVAYGIDYSFWPDTKTREQIDEEFDSQRDFLLSAANAILEYEAIIDTLGYPGRELYLTIDGSEIKTRYWMYFDKGVMYKLYVVTEHGKHFNESVLKFLNSFRTPT